jgi:hypothetical protein
MPPRYRKGLADAVGPPEPDDSRKQIAGERLAPLRRSGSHEVTFAESSPEISKVRIGREKPRNDSSPTSRLTT